MSYVLKKGKDFPMSRETGGKEFACQTGDTVQSLGQEDALEKQMATPLQYSCLENSRDRGAWWATVHGIAKEFDTTEQLNNRENSTDKGTKVGKENHMGDGEYARSVCPCLAMVRSAGQDD